MLKLDSGESSVINFGAVIPGEAQKSIMFVASSAANVTARIDGGGDRFRIVTVACQAVSSRQLTPDEIDQLPPHMRNDPRYHVSIERTVIGTSDGVTPLTVGEQQEVVFYVAFRGEDHAAEGGHSATLVIIGAGSPITVPMSALVGQVKADVPTTTVSVTQGETAVLSVTVRSAFGPDTAVRFEMDANTGLSMKPVVVSVPRSGQIEASLRIEAARFAETIQFQKYLQMSAFDGRQVTFLPLSFHIHPAPIPPEQSPAHIQPIKPDWWQWRGENPRNRPWKEEYSVSGTFTNKGGFNIQDLAITIFETTEDMGSIMGEANQGSTEHGLVMPSREVTGATGSLKKEWQWFIPVVWVVKGPIYKDFRYKALISAKDVNGNPYPPVTSAELRVTVIVSTPKYLAGQFAMKAAIAAAVFAASIIMAAVGAAAYAAASVAGAIALDPPEPDPNFQGRILLPPLGEVPASGPNRNVIRLYRLSERIMRIELTKSLIEGRRLGALAAGDAQWAENHKQDLAAATALQRSLANEVRGLEPQAKQDIMALVPPGTELRHAREQLINSGLTTELAEQMQLPEEHWSGFDALLRSDLALADTDIVGTVGATVAPLAEFADSLA
ncbi:hypothetical protein [Desulfosporosinus nitroreducens]|uniref:Uncharacterized protein n=1 Tax=Desulfosporosinus nitroreducens TaxID=2018668 RepID=A0ABT8QWQ0_9FIRM|nr:hypothetical protein [Desulfosporosinus nitroreducens]MCO1602008.1 hypothetical protein [Desulfosporosinus nitroreducens]MDO0825302.1 hypothetical protein [Desulfosporosinus nitroreducens]